MKFRLVRWALLLSFGCAAQSTSRELRRETLPAPFAGQEARVLEVTIPPGPGSKPHRHPGLVMGYVLDGALRFALDGGPPQTVKTGEVFYEPPNILHTMSASADPNKPVRFLVFFVGDTGEEITIREH
jgi:quercetin dioxygenase-like cupin family protein